MIIQVTCISTPPIYIEQAMPETLRRLVTSTTPATVAKEYKKQSQEARSTCHGIPSWTKHHLHLNGAFLSGSTSLISTPPAHLLASLDGGGAVIAVVPVYNTDIQMELK